MTFYDLKSHYRPDMVIKEEKQTYLGIKLRSPAPQGNMLPTELPRRPEGMLLLQDLWNNSENSGK
jgi:hypothetical protein